MTTTKRTDQRDPHHGYEPEAVRLRGGPFDGTTLHSVPHRVVKLAMDDEWYYRVHRHASGDAAFHHASIWGRA